MDCDLIEFPSQVNKIIIAIPNLKKRADRKRKAAL
jgi:hypothetical protein